MNQQTIDQIHQTTQGSFNGTMSFPEVVGSLMSVGVSYYYIDLLSKEKTCYFRTGDTHREPISVPNLPVMDMFSASEVAAAVRSSQTEGQIFTVFLDRILAAGCVGYFAYLDGRKVVYLGARGEEHVELMP